MCVCVKKSIVWGSNKQILSTAQDQKAIVRKDDEPHQSQVKRSATEADNKIYKHKQGQGDSKVDTDSPVVQTRLLRGADVVK